MTVFAMEFHLLFAHAIVSIAYILSKKAVIVNRIVSFIHTGRLRPEALLNPL